MIDPKTSFEKRFGKLDEFEFPEQWLDKFNLYLDGWMDGYAYCGEITELTKAVRSLSDLQRGVD